MSYYFPIDNILTLIWNLPGHTTNSIEHSSCEVNSRSGSQIMCPLWEPTHSIAHSKQPATGFHPEPDEFTPYSYPLFI
jgi:hypothetical protein